MELINLFIASILTENVVLNRFLGICPFMGTSSKHRNALYMGLSVTLVMVMSSLLTYTIYHYLLVPYQVTYLKNIMFILIIASLVQLLEILLKKLLPVVYNALGLYLPLITTNCAVLGIALLNITNDYSLIEVLVFSISSALGFTLVLYIFSNLRERLEQLDVAKSFKGTPIALITAGIMALIFARFSV